MRVVLKTYMSYMLRNLAELEYNQKLERDSVYQFSFN